MPCDVIIKRRIIPMRLSGIFRGGGGGGVEARRPENSLENVFFFVCFSSTYFTDYRGDPMVLLHRKLNISRVRGPTFSRVGGPNAHFNRNPYNVNVIFQGGGGGPDTLSPLRIST